MFFNLCRGAAQSGNIVRTVCRMDREAPTRGAANFYTITVDVASMTGIARPSLDDARQLNDDLSPSSVVAAGRLAAFELEYSDEGMAGAVLVDIDGTGAVTWSIFGQGQRQVRPRYSRAQRVLRSSCATRVERIETAPGERAANEVLLSSRMVR